MRAHATVMDLGPSTNDPSLRRRPTLSSSSAASCPYPSSTRRESRRLQDANDVVGRETTKASLTIASGSDSDFFDDPERAADDFGYPGSAKAQPSPETEPAPASPFRATGRPLSWLDIDNRASEEDGEYSRSSEEKQLPASCSAPQLYATKSLRRVARPRPNAAIHRDSLTALPSASGNRDDAYLPQTTNCQKCKSRRMLSNESDDATLTALPLFPQDDPWRLPALALEPLPLRKKPASKPQSSLARLSSLDNLLRFKEEKEEWKRASLVEQQMPTLPSHPNAGVDLTSPVSSLMLLGREKAPKGDIEMQHVPSDGEFDPVVNPASLPEERIPRRFRHLIAEVGFCFTIASTQFLAEYLISGFAIELSKLPSLSSRGKSRPHSESMGLFWPASLLSLVLSAMLLIFARLSDMYGGYSAFMTGIAWLAIWTLIPGFARGAVMVDISRAMQGLAIAAFMPATFALVGSVYPEGRRKNFVLGLYSGCAPLGFFSGLFVAAALPAERSRWYFWIAAALSGFTLVAAFLTVPLDRTDRGKLDLKMDWIGSFWITSGLLLVSYALSVEPYASTLDTPMSGFSSPMVLGPLISGSGALIVAFWYEGWRAACPLLPFDFFKPKSVKAFSLACLCFYASYGAWLYNSAGYFESLTGAATSGEKKVTGMKLAFWYLPAAIGGVVLCVIGSSILHIIPIMLLLVLSGLAWIAAPVLLAVAPLPLEYWKYVMPSMVCATLGIDVTFTVSIIFLSSVQPLKYQGLTGAVSSILANLAMSFALSISEIVSKTAERNFHQVARPEQSSLLRSTAKTQRGFQAAFIYAAVSGSIGLAICIMFVRVSRSVVSKNRTEEERSQAGSLTTMAEDGVEGISEHHQQQQQRQP